MIQTGAGFVFGGILETKSESTNDYDFLIIDT